VNRRCGRTYRLHLQGRKIREQRAEDGILHSHRCENLKLYKNNFTDEGQHQMFALHEKKKSQKYFDC
jgi:hypothetical protein